jgi:hypothetical protein
LTFLNTAFLFTAFAALLPLIIHMISRRRVDTIDFSSIRFLKQLERKKIRRVRIRQILLLIIRSLILLFAALAMARPTLRGAFEGGVSTHARTSVAIVIDDSASMSRRANGGALFDEAVATVRAIAGLLSGGDEAFLLTASSPTGIVVGDGTFSPDVLADELDGLRPTEAGTDSRRAVATALEYLGASRNLNREMYVIGDMQQSGWENEVGPSVEMSGETGLPAETAGGDVRAYLVPVTGPTGNCAVTAVRVERRYGGTPGMYAVIAEMRNLAARSCEIPVRLFVDGIQVGQTGVTMEEGAGGSAVFSTAVDVNEWHSGWVEIPADILDVDNRRYFVIRPEERIEVLVVGSDGAPRSGGRVGAPEGSGRVGAPEGSGRVGALDDSYYIERALDPTRAGVRFRPVMLTAAALAHQEQGRFPVVVLADIGRLDDAAERWIERHLSGSGGLLAVLGGGTDIRYWNAELLPLLGGGSILAPVERWSGVRLAPVSAGHPLLAGLVFGDGLIDDVAVRKTFRVEIDGADEIMELPGIGPAMVATTPPAGGAAALLYTGIDPAWSDIPRSGLLVPLLHRITGRLAEPAVRELHCLVGGDLVVPYDPSHAGAPVVLLPDGGEESATRMSGSRGGASLRGVSQTGIYEFMENGELLAMGAVNLPGEESELAAVSEAGMTQLLDPLEVSIVTPGAELKEEILVARHGRELWRTFVYIALALLALEMYVARPRFARQ